MSAQASAAGTPARELFKRPKYWAHQFGVAPVLPTSRAEMEFGWKARIPFEDGLRETIEWYERNRGTVNPALLRSQGERQ